MPTRIGKRPRLGNETEIKIKHQQLLLAFLLRLRQHPAISRNHRRSASARRAHERTPLRPHLFQTTFRQQSDAVEHKRLTLDGISLRSHLTAFNTHAIEAGRAIDKMVQRRPGRNMDLLVLRKGVVLEQRLDVLPATQLPDLAHICYVDDRC